MTGKEVVIKGWSTRALFGWLVFAFILGVLFVLGLMATGTLDRILGDGRPPKPVPAPAPLPPVVPAPAPAPDTGPTPVGNEWGHFVGNPKSEWLEDGRLMRLLEDFAYVDGAGKTWAAKKDAVVNGASIPQFFWTFTGGPLEGQYRNASIVHDTACDAKTEKWEDVHTMFYHACRCGGVPKNQAQLLFWAVYHKGPRWRYVAEMKMERVIGLDGQEKEVPVTVQMALPIIRDVPINEEEVKRLQKQIEEKDLSIDDLKNLENP